MAVKNQSYTAEQAEELDRALEAQYEADKCRRTQSSDVEREEWRKIRRVSAQRVFDASKHGE
jgi:hypothetical protein